jgi:hypothetical protein
MRRFATCGAKRRKVMFAAETANRFPHGFKVQRIMNMPGAI